MDESNDRGTRDRGPDSGEPSNVSASPDPMETRAVDVSSVRPAGPEIGHETWLGKTRRTRLGRYEIVSLLGAGGMGIVFKAYDPTLKRNIALKILHGRHPDLATRFLQEAASQARVDHDSICKVHEAGELDGELYIAMQLIEGQTLQELRSELTTREKVEIIYQVAQAIGAAHNSGLIHRDLKPGNIMVRKVVGTWKAYVLDFGLARETETPGLTLSGTVLGTPQYMSPEQARGDVRQLDCRSDIYSLGASLYELLSGVAPVSGSNPAEILWNVIHSEPASLKKTQAAPATDLEAIVMKCLEKTPNFRYQTARELEEDLKRFLDGEPVLARPVRRIKKWTVKLRRNKKAFAGISIATILIILSSITGIYFYWQAREEQRFIIEFGQEVKYVDGYMRNAYAAPLHNVRPEEKTILARIVMLKDRITRESQAAAGPGHYAVGRCYMAIGDYKDAEQHLKTAWQKYGFQNEEIALSLGLTLAMRYKEELAAAEQIEEGTAHDAKVADIEKEYRDQSLDFIQRGRAVVSESPEYVEALVGLLSKNYTLSLSKCKEAIAKVPWRYEAYILMGSAHEEMGSVERRKGNYQDAFKIYQDAKTAYKESISRAPSNRVAHRALCSMETSVLFLHYQSGTIPRDFYNEAVDICNNNLIADPEDAESYQDLAYIHRMFSYFAPGQFTDLYKKALDAAQRAVSLQPDSSESYLTLGRTFDMKGREELKNGADPRESFLRAIDYYRMSLKRNPNSFVSYNDSGISFMLLAQYEFKKGLDWRNSSNNAIENYEKALHINPDDQLARANLGLLFVDRGIRDMDPISLDRAIQCFQKVLSRNPDTIYNYSNLAFAANERAAYQMRMGLDPGRFLEMAIDSLESANSINPALFYTHENLGESYRLKAQHLFHEGSDSRAVLDQAIQSYQRALDLDPTYFPARHELGMAYFLKGEEAIKFGSSGEPYLRSALETLKMAAEQNSSESGPYVSTSQVYRVYIEGDLSSHRNPEFHLRASQTAVKEALKRKPDSYVGLQEKGKVDLLQAECFMRREKSPQADFDSAQASFEKAVALQPRDASLYQDLAGLRERRAEWLLKNMNTDQALKEVKAGIEQIEKALQLNPRLPHAQTLRQMLYDLRDRLS